MRASLKPTDTLRVTRRSSLAAALTGGLALLGASRPASAQAAQKASLLARSVERVPNDPQDPLWQKSDVLSLPLAPQAVVKPRIYETGVESVSLHALYDANTVAFLLKWTAPEQHTEMDGVGAFRDAAAIEFPADPTKGIPHFAMGEPNKPVTIYQWKADWEFGRDVDVEEHFPAMAADWYPFAGRGPGEIAELTDYDGKRGDKAFHPSWWAGNPLGDPELQTRTPVEKLRAEGFGTLTTLGPEGQDATGRGEWKDGVWRVVISVPRVQEAFAFAPGITIPVAFAVWDGARRERGGEKAVSTWYFVSLEQPVGTAVYWAPAAAVIGVATMIALGLRRLRRWAAEEGEDTKAETE